MRRKAIAISMTLLILPFPILASGSHTGIADQIWGIENNDGTFGVTNIDNFNPTTDTTTTISIVPASPSENGRGIAYDGTNLWYTVLSGAGSFTGDGLIHKVAPTGGPDIATIPDPFGPGGRGIGALDFDGTNLWAISYLADSSLMETIFKINPTDGTVLASCAILFGINAIGADTLAIVKGKILTNIELSRNILLEYDPPSSIGGSCTKTGNVFSLPLGVTGIDTDSAGNLVVTDKTNIYNLGGPPYGMILGSQNNAFPSGKEEDITTAAIKELIRPVANSQAVSTNENTPITITLTGSSANGLALVFSIVTLPLHGALSAIAPIGPTSAQVTYTPNIAFNGADSFTFKVNDGTLDSNVATVSITVNPAVQSATAGHTGTLPASKDSFLRQEAKDTNEGINPILRIEGSGQNSALVAFDQGQIATVAAGKTLLAAKLRFFVISNTISFDKTGDAINAHRLLADWTEGNGWNLGNAISGTGPGVTWRCASDNNINNGQPDCDRKWNGGNFQQAESSSVTITNSMLNQWIEFDVTQDVKTFLNGTPNYGWLVEIQQNKNGSVILDSREASLNGPQLVLLFS